jgi:ABC-type glycerol-3-phosphate transport system substrate-binding protein
MLRQDLLDAYGLTEPETIADFETVLYAFKENGVRIPYSTIGLRVCCWAAAVTSGYDLKTYEYQDGATHEVKYGAVQPEFKPF